ncbi:MAG TPA: M1 family aminopeptidase [Desulfuromonadaceae bacterium]|jgi:hypothetical protein
MFFLLALLLLTLSCAAANDLKVEQQEIAVTLVPENQLIAGESTMILSDDNGTLKLQLSPTTFIEKVLVSGKQVPFSFGKGLLAIEISQRKHKPVTVTVNYHNLFKDSVPERPANQEDPTFGVTGAITPQGVFLGGDAGWYPVPATPPKRRIIRISAPAGTEAVTSGKRDSRETKQGISRSTWREERPVGTPTISAGPYRIEERRLGNIDLYTYFYPDNAHLASRYLEAASKYIQFYNELLGPYPFEKFAIVENFFPTGYGFPSYTLLGSAIIRLPFIIDTSLPHEIAHNWWGNGVLAEYREGNWSEGLVTYLADYLLKEQKAADQGRDARLQFLTDYATLVPPDKDFPLRDFSGRVDPASRSIGYSKAAMVFHMLRHNLGDQAFYGALRDVYREKLFRSATWSDFIQAFSRRAGKDMSSFIEQWLNRPGGPQFSLSNVDYRSKGGLWEVSGVLKQPAPFYQLPLPLRLETESGTVEKSLPVSGERTPFSFTTPTRPVRLLLDPAVNIFRILATADLPATVNRIKGSDQLLFIVTESCRASKDSLQLLLQSLGQSGTRLIDEKVVDETALSRHDLFFCGTPKNPVLLGSPPERLKISATGFALDGNEYSQPRDLLFMVMPRATATERISALFLPLSKEAAQQYALKITHYGRYSYLVFSNGENRHKGLFPAGSVGSVVKFPRKPMP